VAAAQPRGAAEGEAEMAAAPVPAHTPLLLLSVRVEAGQTRILIAIIPNNFQDYTVHM